MDLADFQPWLDRWRLTPDGEAFDSTWSRLLPVRRDGRALMLKACMAGQEVHGSAFLAGYGGQGAVRVLEREADAVLLERAGAPLSLSDIARGRGEEVAFATLCSAVATLQSAPGPFPVEPIPLATWFNVIREASAFTGGIYTRAEAVLERLLATTVVEAPLHGDLHHGNLLDGGERGWLAIDPKGLTGDPACDYAIMLFPGEGSAGVAVPELVRSRLARVAALADLPPARLAGWALCVSAQYAGWFHGTPMGEAMMAAALRLEADEVLAGI